MRLVAALFITLSMILAACSSESKENAEKSTIGKTTLQANYEEKSTEEEPSVKTAQSSETSHADDSNNTQTGEGSSTNDQQKNQADSESHEVKREIDVSLCKPAKSQLRPFNEQGEPAFTEKVIDSNREYLQLKVQLGDSVTTEVYKWNQDEMTLIYQDTELENHDSSILDNFEPNMHEVIYGKNPDWQLVQKNASLKIGSKTYENVMVLKRVTQEIVGTDTIKVRYYAPNYGMVKEEVEVKGDGGYKSSVELTQDK